MRSVPLMSLACGAMIAGGLVTRESRAATNAVSDPPKMPQHTHTNRLSKEKSPYLLQHQHNPVDWHAWGGEAFEQAKKENKPILLSIGYSTCHWCHVMERESFEDEKLAEFLNAHFVSIKVDREERPDVDKIYMTAAQAMGIGGGWPLNVFLTPELKPFYGGTYFPPEPKYGRPSFLQLLHRIQELWDSKHGDVIDSAATVHRKLELMSSVELTNGLALAPSVLKQAVRQFKAEYDHRHGGFGGAPKFPRPTVPSLVLSQSVQSGDKDGVEMILHTCERMAAGGMYDQLGGGFARYSVDEKWLVPHFEKMLYDNAQLTHLYLDAWLVGGDRRFAATARETVDYVLRDMTHPDGGFYSAEDADSEGKEGKFYCWTKEELASLLPPGELKVVVKYFGITSDGNFVDHSDPHPLPHQNVLSVVDPKLDAASLALLASAKGKLFATRSRRVRPHLDDKTLSSWNGMMLGAVARAGAVLKEPAYIKAAERNLAFLKAKLWDAQGKTLYHRWREGERDSVQLLDAYANLLAGVIELYEVTLNPAHLEFAIELADGMISRFYDKQDGGFWTSPAGSADLILRVKEDYDGAEPSGNSVAVGALLKLAAITERGDFKEAADKSLKLFAHKLQSYPQMVPALLLALDFWMEEPKRIVIAGDPNSDEAKALLQAAHGVYHPRKVVLGTTGPVEPFAQTLKPVNGPVSAYLCTGKACQLPTGDTAKLATMIKDKKQ